MIIHYTIRMQIYSYNGAAIVAMAGDKCVAIASDLRFGVQMQTMACDYQKLFQIHDKLFVGLAGLATDQKTLCVSCTTRLRWKSATYGIAISYAMYMLETGTMVTVEMLYVI